MTTSSSAGAFSGRTSTFANASLQDVLGQLAVADAMLEIAKERPMVLEQDGQRGRRIVILQPRPSAAAKSSEWVAPRSPH
jgi:hypothetical protein